MTWDCVTPSTATSIVVGGPLNSGILAGRDTWNYRTAPPEIVERVEAIRAVCDSHGVPLAAAALQFPLAHPAVAAIIPGPRNADEFHANLELLRAHGDYLRQIITHRFGVGEIQSAFELFFRGETGKVVIEQ